MLCLRVIQGSFRIPERSKSVSRSLLGEYRSLLRVIQGSFRIPELYPAPRTPLADVADVAVEVGEVSRALAAAFGERDEQHIKYKSSAKRKARGLQRANDFLRQVSRPQPSAPSPQPSALSPQPPTLSRKPYILNPNSACSAPTFRANTFCSINPSRQSNKMCVHID